MPVLPPPPSLAGVLIPPPAPRAGPALPTRPFVGTGAGRFVKASTGPWESLHCGCQIPGVSRAPTRRRCLPGRRGLRGRIVGGGSPWQLPRLFAQRRGQPVTGCRSRARTPPLHRGGGAAHGHQPGLSPQSCPVGAQTGRSFRLQSPLCPACPHSCAPWGLRGQMGDGPALPGSSPPRLSDA